MALNAANLRTELAKIMDKDDPLFTGYPATPTQAAANWASAYHVYALAALDVSGDTFLVAPVATNFSSTLVATLPPPLTGTPAQAAAAFDAAFVAYWTGVTFAVSVLIAPPPFVPACPNIGLGTNIWVIETTSTAVVTSGVLEGQLLPIFNLNSGDTQSKINAMRDAFHLATTSAITVTIVGTDSTPPPGGPLPISNICTVF